MKVTSKKTYEIIKAMLEMKKFTQYQISKKQNITFSLVNRVVNWFISHGYVAKRTGYYEVIACAAIFSLFSLYRKIKPIAVFDVALPAKKAMEMIKGKGVLCLTTALAYHDNYFRDQAIHVYLQDEKLIDELRYLPKGYTHIELYGEDLCKSDMVKKDRQTITDKTRTIIDLFCANKAYAAERLIKTEWI